MMPKMIPIPNTDMYLTELSVVMFPDGSDTKWLVKYGWCSYQESLIFGWYYRSISEGIIEPLTEESLVDIIVVSGAFIPPWPHPQPCPPPPFPPHPPCPPPPVPPYPEQPAYISKEEKERYDTAFITFDTLAARDAFTRNNDVPDGKVVRVNDIGDGEVGYYVWDNTAQEWNTWEVSAITHVSPDDLILSVDSDGALHSTLDASLQIDTEEQTAEINITGNDGATVTSVDVTPLIPKWHVVVTR